MVSVGKVTHSFTRTAVAVFTETMTTAAVHTSTTLGSLLLLIDGIATRKLLSVFGSQIVLWRHYPPTQSEWLLRSCHHQVEASCTANRKIFLNKWDR